MRNTGGRSGPQGLEEPTSDEVLRELCDKSYHQLLPLIAKKMQKEKEQHDKLNAVKARLLYGDEFGRNPRNHEESHYSESKTPTARTKLRRRHGSKHSRSPSPITSVGGKEQSASAHSDSLHQSPHAKGTEVRPRKHHHRGTSPRGANRYSESEDSEGGHWKSKSKRHRVWFGKLPKESIDSCEDLRAAFRENYLQQTKHIKDPVEIHHIKQRDGESTEDFMKDTKHKSWTWKERQNA
ncbi:hypothetical protein Tco_0525490 [Tanacetum coccineum]